MNTLSRPAGSSSSRAGWRLFWLCVTATVVALGLVSWQALRLDRRAAEARTEAHRQDLLREAVWRLDSVIAPVLIEESARPAYHYVPSTLGRPNRGETAAPVPSPLVTKPQGMFRLHFQLEPGGKPTSPHAQSDPEVSAALLDELAESVNLVSLAAEIALEEKPSFRTPGERDLEPMRQGTLHPHIFRSARTGQVELLFARLVAVGEFERLQGFWLDWRRLRGRLLVQVRDLFPDADILPADDVTAARKDHERLATIPAVLIPGEPKVRPIPSLRAAPLGLGVVWLAALGAIAAAGVGLRAAQDLSDRRARFVSAVTHELRTPLTTFCMYSEMLADGMVSGEEARAEYLLTLKSESLRLRGIVDNVLLYARVEQGRGLPQAGPIDVGELLDRALPDLQRRAEEAGFELVVTDAPATGGVRALADPEAVGRVLFNLVDNACKYATDAVDRRIVIDASLSGSTVAITVQDRGPGVEAGRDVFEPFQRGRAQETGTTPGIGLGLSLSRGVARAMGGELELAPESGDKPGACFRLSLRVARSA